MSPLLFLLLAYANLCYSSVDVVPNIDILGYGYEMAKGTPRPTILPFDPGFRAPLFDTTHRPDRRLSADKRFALPRFVESTQCVSCQESSDVEVVTSISKYRESQAKQNGFGISVKIPLSTSPDAILSQLGPISGPSLSIGFESNQEHRIAEAELSSSKQVRVESLTQCAAYCASIATFNLTKDDFTPNFMQAVKQLRPNRASFSRFFDTFGTHFVSGLVLGSSLYRVVKFSSADWSNLKSKYDSVEKSFSISIGVGVMGKEVGWGFSMSKKSWTTEEELKQISEKSLSMQDYTIGAVPRQRNGSVKTWQNDSMQAPMPIYINLTPIAALLTKQYFPTDASIDDRRKWVINYHRGVGYEEYLEGIETGQNFVESADFYGGTYASNFLSNTPINNPLTKKANCQDGFRRIAMLMKRTGTLSNFYLCNDDYAELSGPFGGLFAQFWRSHCPLICKPGTEVISPGGFKTCDAKDKIPDVSACKTYATSDTGASSYVIDKNPFTRDASCPPDFVPYKLAHVTECQVTPQNPCANTAIRIEVMACFNRERFVQRYSNIGGFYALQTNNTSPAVVLVKNPITNGASCPDGYKPFLVLNGHDNGSGYVCVMEKSQYD